MTPTIEIIHPKINKTRKSLETRFSQFEKTFFQEMAKRLLVPAKPEAAESLNLSPALKGQNPEPGEHEENAKLKKLAADSQSQIRTLEQTVENLKESLKAMGSERQELVRRIQELEELPKKLPGTDKNMAQPDPGSALLKQNLDRYKKRSLRAARFLKRWRRSFREQKNLARNVSEQGEKSLTQNAKLAAELDSALELIAELRDELHWVRQKDSPAN